MPAQEQQPATILIVEDAPVWQHMLRSLLQQEGFNVVSAFDYSDALHQLQSLYPPPELAIVDLVFPSSQSQHAYDGLHILATLRAKGLYAIVLSGVLPGVVESLAGRPEVRDLIDKVHFTTQDFTEHFFLAKVRAAVAYAQAARRAEGKLLEQQNRLHSLLPPTQR